MTTDPLCPQQHTHPKHNPNRCIFCKEFAAVREDERGKAIEAYKATTEALGEFFEPYHMPVWAAGYEQGQRDEREKWEPMVQALTDELLAKAQPDASMGAQYLAGVAVGQRDELGRQQGYAAALDAARDAVRGAALSISVDPHRDALAAIDALKGNQP